MKSAKEESTGYTDTSFMKPSLIYFPIIRTISRIVSKFRSSSHSLATFHESDIPNFRFSMVMVWCDNLPSVGLSPAACSSHSRPERTCTRLLPVSPVPSARYTGFFPTAGLPPTEWVQDAPCIRLSATGGCLPAYRGTVSGIAACTDGNGTLPAVFLSCG